MTSSKSLETVRSLADLNAVVDLCPRCADRNNRLQHVYGGGAEDSPRHCFVLINPTYRNISTKPGYQGPRLPFLGIRSFWRSLARSGFLTADVLNLIDARQWTEHTTSALVGELRTQSIYITNLVKCADQSSQSPTLKTCCANLPILRREMELVRPRQIVAFGRLTVFALTGRSLTLSAHYDAIRTHGVQRDSYLHSPHIPGIPILPNYFPVGRGNQRFAIEILQKYRAFAGRG